MWDGVTYVDPNRSPIISEGRDATRVVVMNAGPFSIVLRGWPVTSPETTQKPEIEVRLWPGNTISISASLIRAELTEGPHHSNTPVPVPFAALAWRIVP